MFWQLSSGTGHVWLKSSCVQYKASSYKCVSYMTGKRCKTRIMVEANHNMQCFIHIKSLSSSVTPSINQCQKWIHKYIKHNNMYVIKNLLIYIYSGEVFLPQSRSKHQVTSLSFVWGHRWRIYWFGGMDIEAEIAQVVKGLIGGPVVTFFVSKRMGSRHTSASASISTLSWNESSINIPCYNWKKLLGA